MCDLVATSREHAPPACFFPEAETFGRDLRRNLITVPSCDAHNLGKSADDEFFRAVLLLATVSGSNASEHQFFEKLLVAVRRKPDAHAAFIKDTGTAENGKLRALRIDRHRFDRCMDQLIRALFFHAYQRKWLLPLVVESPDLFVAIEDDQPATYKLAVAALTATKEYLQFEPVKGDNPEVFQYRLKFDESGLTFAFACRFFEQFEVLAYSSATLTTSD